MVQVTCTPVFSVVKEVGLTWLFHETREAKAPLQEHLVHFVSLPGLSLGQMGPRISSTWGLQGPDSEKKDTGDNRVPQESAKGQVLK